MKTSLSIIALGALLSFASPQAAHGAEFTVLRVCEDNLVLHTSDRADAGRISHVVIDTGSRAIVSVLVTGGVIAERTVAVPFTSVQFGPAREVTLVEIDRQRLVSAPVIERSSIATTSFESSWVERSRTHFASKSTSTTTERRGDQPGRDDRNRPDSREGVQERQRGAEERRPSDQPPSDDRKKGDRPDSSAPPRERTDRPDGEAKKIGPKADESTPSRDKGGKSDPDAAKKEQGKDAPCRSQPLRHTAQTVRRAEALSTKTLARRAVPSH
jgi:hypothetical protein